MKVMSTWKDFHRGHHIGYVIAVRSGDLIVHAKAADERSATNLADRVAKDTITLDMVRETQYSPWLW